MVNTLRINADHGRDFYLLADHMTFPKGENREFSAFPLSRQLMFDQTLSNAIVCLMISQKLHAKVAQMSCRVAVDTR